MGLLIRDPVLPPLLILIMKVVLCSNKGCRVRPLIIALLFLSEQVGQGFLASSPSFLFGVLFPTRNGVSSPCVPGAGVCYWKRPWAQLHKWLKLLVHLPSPSPLCQHNGLVIVWPK